MDGGMAIGLKTFVIYSHNRNVKSLTFLLLVIANIENLLHVLRQNTQLELHNNIARGPLPVSRYRPDATSDCQCFALSAAMLLVCGARTAATRGLRKSKTCGSGACSM